ncbi:demethoxyubiquinone hydroxylase family protein [Janthinobacterium sp. PLB04]|nr:MULTISPECIES: demethoxyubiquinone hydroxylase family protein [Janthinobacterium]UGQ39093.1 demethoxyubiquinone hydroxylase family protein [Janthinobacterium sp. PLB04]
MKVNHAGEQGAIGIYTGQIFMARWTASHIVQELLHHRHSWRLRLQRGFKIWPMTGMAGKEKRSGETSRIVFC